MYNTLDLVNFIDNSDDNSDEGSYDNFNMMYCENDDCCNDSTKNLFGDYYCNQCYPNFDYSKLNTDIIKLIYKQGIDNTYPSIGNRIYLHYKGFVIDDDGEHEFYNTYKKGIKEIILGDESNLKLFNTVITSMNKGEQSIFLTNISYINYLNNLKEKYDEDEDEENKIEKFKFEIEIIDISNPIIFTKRIII
tara:strand:- start:264 stop:839 length:576 start_codon:yes stop_codon:yes gene_type:complete